MSLALRRFRSIETTISASIGNKPGNDAFQHVYYRSETTIQASSKNFVENYIDNIEAQGKLALPDKEIKNIVDTNYPSLNLASEEKDSWKKKWTEEELEELDLSDNMDLSEDLDPEELTDSSGETDALEERIYAARAEATKLRIKASRARAEGNIEQAKELEQEARNKVNDSKKLNQQSSSMMAASMMQNKMRILGTMYLKILKTLLLGIP